MKTFFGMALYIVSYPARWLFLRGSVRPRVVVLHEEEILLVRGFIDTEKWGLPGGGAHKNEKYAEAASRELQEETGINVTADQIELLGIVTVNDYGIRYRSPIFVVKLHKRPKLQLSRELTQAEWFSVPHLPKPLKDSTKQSLELLDINGG